MENGSYSLKSALTSTEPVIHPSLASSAFQKTRTINYDKLYKRFLERTSACLERDSQSSELAFERFELHNASPLNTTSYSLRRNKPVETEKAIILAKLRNCYFEPGLWTDVDEYFAKLVKDYYDLETGLDILSDIVNHNLADEHVLEGVLHILSSYTYEAIKPYGITISIACAFNHSPVVLDLLISCFENWGSNDAVDILTGMELHHAWLAKYRDEVVAYLLSKDNSA